MRAFKTFFWTTLFWVLVLFIVFLYAKYTKGGDSISNFVVKSLWVTPQVEGIVDWDTNLVNDKVANLELMIAELQADVKVLLGEDATPVFTEDTSTTTTSTTTDTTEDTVVTDDTTTDDTTPDDDTTSDDADTTTPDDTTGTGSATGTGTAE